MDQQQFRQHALSFIDQLRRLEDGDACAVDALAALFGDNAQLRNPFVDHAGRERIAAFWRSYRASFGTVQSTFSHITVADYCAGLFWRSVGTGPQGQPVDDEGVTLLEFDEGGKITRLRGYVDSRQVRIDAPAHGAGRSGCRD
ncbi:nuclear transport factor 2 family protein [Massilia atriviolacea]|uniref:Nuclear transport factor 2 family protein n=1 Tax=Massilia atriviolacea TaxID=2495579 RepID=A0A430HI23_9BURK|nr:nuclear transport factor 2 family protein [Massilia atriviolacea]RSZ57162.1 nuclear transport factor 2 family protein [Massilia atriviolacea]